MSSVSHGPTLVGLDGVPGLILPDETVGGASATLKPLRCRTPESVSFADLACVGGALDVEAASEVSVWAFNTPEDRDPDLVLAPPGTGPPGGDTGQVELSPAACWLVVRHQASAHGEGSDGAADPLSQFRVRVPVVCADYRRHERSESAARAVVEDLLHPRFAQRLDDVRALRSGEALAFEAPATLTTVLDVSWSDVLAGGLGALAGIVGAAAPLTVQLPATASVRGTMRVAGSFSFVFARVQNGRTRVAVKRGAIRAPDVGADPDLAVELADPQQLEAALHDLVAGLLGCSHVTVRALFEKVSLAELSEDEREAGATLATYLGLGALERGFASFQQKLRELEGAIAEALAELATGKLAEGFAYEYARLARGAVLFQAVLDPEGLERFHAPLCRGDLVPLLSAIAEGTPGVTLESYLRRRSLERSRCWGFTLGVGPWAASGRQRRTLTRLVHDDPTGRRKVSCLGLGAYEGRWLADVADWTADLRADMPRFARGEGVLVQDFELGLHLAWHWRHVRLEADELEATLDMGILWGVVDPQQVAAVRGHLGRALGRAAEVTVQLRIDDAPFRALLRAVAAGRDADFAAALGAAMAWRKSSPGRGDPVRRRELYGPLWAHVLEQPDAPARALVALARTQLADCADPQLGFLEENYLRLTPTSTFVGLARVANQSTAAAWAGFRSGARLLHEALASAAKEDDTFERAFSLMVSLWAQPHHVRALGAFLLDAALQAGVADAFARTLTIVAGDAGSETALVVAAPAT